MQSPKRWISRLSSSQTVTILGLVLVGTRVAVYRYELVVRDHCRRFNPAICHVFGGTTSQQVGKRSDAIRKCGAEIVKLRKHIEDIDQERCHLRSQLKILHRTTAEAEMVSGHSLFWSRSQNYGVSSIACSR